MSHIRNSILTVAHGDSNWVCSQSALDIIFVIYHSFNKRQEDFPSLKEYNDYLEEVEKIGNLLDALTSCPLLLSINETQFS